MKKKLIGGISLDREKVRKIWMTMRLITLFFFVSLVHVSASVYSQKTRLNIKVENATLQEVFKTIQDQTEFDFFYKNDQIPAEARVSVQYQNETVEAILDRVLSGTGLNYHVLDKDIVISNNGETKSEIVSQQQKSVSGKITDSKGAPLPGVTVAVKGTALGTISSADGTYSLSSLPENATLVFSFVGMKSREIAVGNKTTISISLEDDAIGIEEVVAIGYGTRKKETLTGAIASIQATEIMTTKSTNMVSSLQGKVSGVQIRQRSGEPGMFTSMLSIRGFGTPLIIIDGVARDGIAEFERLNQEDIESISVLKDASAAIYGINADNGVIIVTTKKGTKGDTKVSYSGYYGLSSPTILQKTFDAYNSMLIRNEINRNSGLTPAFSDELLEKYRLGTEPGYQDFDWVSEMLKETASQQQHNLSIRGGSDKISYYTSVGFVENNGIMASGIQKYNKYNFRNNLTVNLSKNLVSNVNIAGRVDNNSGPAGTFFWFLKPLMTVDRRFGAFTIDNPTHITNIPGNSNPYALMTESVSGYDKWDETQYQTSADLTYTVPFVEGLKLKAMIAYDGNVRNASHLNKVYSTYDYYTDDVKAPSGNTTYSNSNTIFKRKDFQAQALYDHTFAETHHVSATTIFEMKSIKQNYLTAQRQWDELFTNDVLDQADLTNLTNGGNRYEEAFMSLLGRLSYDYKSKYLVEFAFRNDGSYRYAPKKRWGFFPSISAGWRVSEEPFIKNNIPYISNLKIRGSYGEIGADPENSAPFQYVGGFTVGAIDQGYVFNNGVLSKAMIPQGVLNDNLTWIKSKTTDIGIDLDLWQGKLGITADIFQKDRDGLLGYRLVAVPNTFGGTFPQENLNSDRVKGFDLVVSHRGKIGEINYGVNANLTYARLYKIYTEKQPYGSSWERWHDMEANGRVQGAYWGYDYDGVYTDIEEYQTSPLVNGYWNPNDGNSHNLPGTPKIVDANGDGKLNADDEMPIFWTGRNNPPLQYGLTLTADWRGIDLNVVLQGASLYTITYANSDMWGYGTHSQITTKFEDRWRTADPNADPFDPATEWIPGYYPALKIGPKGGTPDEFDTKMWEMDATHLRLKSLEIGYTLPNSVCSVLKVDHIRVYVNAYNLYTFANKYVRMFDPERHEGEYNADLTYPLMKSYNFGLNINF